MCVGVITSAAIPPSSPTVVLSPSIRAVLLAQALALPDWVDQTIRQEESDEGGGILFQCCVEADV